VLESAEIVLGSESSVDLQLPARRRENIVFNDDMEYLRSARDFLLNKQTQTIEQHSSRVYKCMLVLMRGFQLEFKIT